jgi:hypothetical protein
MGDKSPKSKEKAKRQDTADKNQKKVAAAAKATNQSMAGRDKKSIK